MKAYKGFDKDLTCILGKSPFKYEIGKTYTEKAAKCASTGFHCVEEPIEVLRWYYNEDSRYCIVEASGDIHEDGNDKISCTEMTIVKEVSLEQIGALECLWVEKHFDRVASDFVKKDEGTASKNGIVVVRGKNPKASGEEGSALFLLQEAKRGKNIIGIGAYKIDGKEHLPGVFYAIDGRRAE